MSPIIKNLCWKEFRELRSGTLSTVAVTLSIPLCYVFRDLSAAFFAVYPTFWLYPFVAGVFFGMRAAAGERTGRTAHFAAALPVSHRLLGATRLIATFIAAAVPLVALLVLGLILRPYADHYSREDHLPLTIGFGLSLFATICCVTVAATAGVGQPSEVRAGAVGVAAIFIVGFVGWIAILGCIQWLSWLGWAQPERVFELIFFGLVLPAAAAQLFAARFVTTYSLALGLPVQRAVHRPSDSSLMPPLPAPLAALIWKGCREIGFLGLAVFLGLLLISILYAPIMQQANDSHTLFESLIKTIPVILLLGGFILAVLIGVGSAISDVQPGVNTFWRSRPISPRAWYWTKYGIGLAILLVAIELPSFICIGAVMLEFTELRSMMLCLTVWNALFSFALTATCLVRQPAPAAILAAGATGILYAVVQAIFDQSINDPFAAMPVLIMVFLIAFILSTFLGAWAAERDIAIT